MKIRESSWHYRFWDYITYDQTFKVVHNWFAPYPPKSLCPYVNRLVAYLLIQLPLMVLIGTMLVLPLIIGPMAWAFTGTINPNDSVTILEALSRVLFLLYLVFAGAAVIITLYCWVSVTKYLPGLRDLELRVPTAIVDTVDLVGGYFNAVHAKLCPMIEVVKDDKEGKSDET